MCLWEKILMPGKSEGREEVGDRGWDGWMASPMQCTWTWANWERVKGQGGLACYSPWGCKELDTTWQLTDKSNNCGMAKRAWRSLGDRSNVQLLNCCPGASFSHWRLETQVEGDFGGHQTFRRICSRKSSTSQQDVTERKPSNVMLNRELLLWTTGHV